MTKPVELHGVPGTGPRPQPAGTVPAPSVPLAVLGTEVSACSDDPTATALQVSFQITSDMTCFSSDKQKRPWHPLASPHLCPHSPQQGPPGRPSLCAQKSPARHARDASGAAGTPYPCPVAKTTVLCWPGNGRRERGGLHGGRPGNARGPALQGNGWVVSSLKPVRPTAGGNHTVNNQQQPENQHSLRDTRDTQQGSHHTAAA